MNGPREHRHLRAALLAVLVGSLSVAGPAISSPASAQGQEGSPHPHVDMNMQEMMKKWQEAATPGEQHRHLNRLVGQWTTKTRMWMGPPGSPPMETEGTAEYRWILDGHYMLMEIHGEMMGQPHTGWGIIGYDNYRKQYTQAWIDNMSTATYFSAGNFDPSGNVLTLYGTMDEPMTGEIGKTVFYKVRLVDEDKHIFEIHDPVLGEGNTKVMEMVYTRM